MSAEPLHPDDPGVVRRCPVCGETNAVDDRECALCGTPLRDTTASAIAVVLTLVLVCVGMLIVLPGLGIPLAIGSIAPIIRMTMVVHRRAERGLETPPWKQWVLYLSSLWVTAVVLWTTGLAAFFAFCFSCLGVASLENSIDGSAIGIASLCAIAVAGLLLWAYSKWMRSRWERDISEKV